MRPAFAQTTSFTEMRPAQPPEVGGGAMGMTEGPAEAMGPGGSQTACSSARVAAQRSRRKTMQSIIRFLRLSMQVANPRNWGAYLVIERLATVRRHVFAASILLGPRLAAGSSRSSDPGVTSSRRARRVLARPRAFGSQPAA